tara:strand:- start:2916 stop:5783 length:2868 start_codon:yes stop_codon:yes gene_type:complete
MGLPGAPIINTDPFPNNGVNSSSPSLKAFTTYLPTQGGIVETVAAGFTVLPNTASILESTGKGNTSLFPFSPIITSTTFDNSVYNALINNFNENRNNSFLMDVDYLDSPTVPVNQQAIINGTAKKAQVPDSNYTSKQVIIPRYLGSKISSANYNFPTRAGRVGPNTGRFIRPSVLPSFLNGDTGSWGGDSSYGNTAVIDKNPIYFAHFKTSVENENLDGTYTFNIDSLIEAPFNNVLGKDFFPNIIKIDGSNQNLSSTVSTFEVGRKATVSYNNTTANNVNFSRLPVGDNVIYQGGLEFDNILWNLDPQLPTSEANPTMSFQNGPTQVNLRVPTQISNTTTTNIRIFPSENQTFPIHRSASSLIYNPFPEETGVGANGVYRSVNPITNVVYNTPGNFLYEYWQDVYGFTTSSISTGKGIPDSTWLVAGNTNLFNLTGSIISQGANIPGSSNLTPNGVIGESLDGTKTITAGFIFSDTSSLQSVSFSSSTGNWKVDEQCFFTSASMGATIPNGVGFNLTLVKENFLNQRKGFFSLGGPILVVSSSRGIGDTVNNTFPSGNPGGNGNVFQATALTAIHTINQSIKNQIPYIDLDPKTPNFSGTGIFRLCETKSFGLPGGVKVNPNDSSNYISYNVTQTILDNQTPGNLTTLAGSIPNQFDLSGSIITSPFINIPDTTGNVLASFKFETTKSFTSNPKLVDATGKFKIGQILEFDKNEFGATSATENLNLTLVEENLINVEKNDSLSYYKNTNVPFLIEVGDEIKISYNSTIGGITSINSATFEVTNVPNNGFDNGIPNDTGSSFLLDGEWKLIANTPIQPQNYYTGSNGVPIVGRANMLYEIRPEILDLKSKYRSSTNCFDKLEVTPNPQDLNPPIPEGKINNLQIIRRTNADDRVIIFQVSPDNSEGVNTPSGPGFIIPNDLTSIQKQNVESLISLLNAKNTFKDEIPSRDGGLTP